MQFIPYLILGVIGWVLLMPKKTLASGYVNGVSSEIELEEIQPGFSLRYDAARSYKLMWNAAFNDGLQLKVDSAFRSMEKQESLYADFLVGKLTTPVAKPGYSNHQSGIAVDIIVHNSNTSFEYVWLNLNAWKFGFTNVGKNFHPPEYWHWEYWP